MGQQVNNSFYDVGWINASVYVSDFYADDRIYGDFLIIFLNLTAELTKSYVYSVTVTIEGDSLASWVMVGAMGVPPVSQVHCENLSLTSYKEGESGRGNIEKASLEFLSGNHSERTSVYIGSQWNLEGFKNESRQLIVRFGTTYFNGTVYKEVVEPFQLRLIVDDENTLSKARMVVSNQTVMDFIGGNDVFDFFRVNLQEGDMFNVTVSPYYHATWAINLFLYGPNGENQPLENMQVTWREPGSILCKIGSSGWYFIEVECLGGAGPYLLTLTAVAE